MATETKFIKIEVNISEAVSELVKIQEAIKDLETQQKALNRTTVAGQEAYAKNTVALKEYRTQLATLVKETANEIKQGEQKLGHIQKLEAQVANLTIKYKQLSEAELASAKGSGILNALKDKRAELSKLEQAYGNYSKNVGNYSSATNMLALNIGQVLKEAPNFAISARIGIMSLTNNLPMLAEAIKAVRIEQQALAAQGKQTQSMFSLITKSIFGLTGVMSIAMVLLQIFGQDIIDWVGSLFKANQQLDLMNENLKKIEEHTFKSMTSEQEKVLKFALDYNKASREGNTERLNQLGRIGREEYNLSNNRLKLIRDNVDNWRIAFSDYLKMAQQTYFNEARIKEGAELEYQAKKLSAERDRVKQKIKEGLDSENPELLMKRLEEGTLKPVFATRKVDDLVDSYYELNKQIIDLNKNLRTLKDIKIADVYSAPFKKLKESSSDNKHKVDKNISELFGWRIDDDGTKTWVTKAEEEAMAEKLKASLKRVSEQMGGLLQSTENSPESFFNNQIDRLLQLYSDGLIGYEEFSAQVNTIMENASKNGVEIFDSLLVEVETVGSQIVQNRTKNLIEYANAAQDVLGSLSDFSSAMAERELANWAKLNQGKANYDEEYAKKKAKLEYDAAVRGKAMSIFGTMITTASSVMAAVAAPPVGLGAAGVPLAILNGINGAAQIAAILATPIPTYNAQSSSSNSSSFTTTTEKFHSGGTIGGTGEVPITALGGESVMTQKATSMFSPLLSSINMMGGGKAITANVGGGSDGMDLITIAFQRALQNMPAPVMSWTEFETQRMRQQKLASNRQIR